MSEEMSQEDRVLTGGCLCGAVRYLLGGAPSTVVVCHCGQCRKTHGDRAGYTIAKKEDLTLTEERGLKWFRSSEGARRGFCQECGASLFYDPIGTDRIAVAAGPLDGATGLKEAGHIFLADKGDYYDAPSDGLPQFPGVWTK